MLFGRIVACCVLFAYTRINMSKYAYFNYSPFWLHIGLYFVFYVVKSKKNIWNLFVIKLILSGTLYISVKVSVRMLAQPFAENN